MLQDSRWIENFEALKAHVDVTGHFPNKHTRLNNWCRYQRKRIKAGTMSEEQRQLFEALAAERSDEHTGGRRKKVEGASA
ncbi:MAG: helicase associated domain-containing protein [Bacteroidaceae bacterium]|nr:helicase associated domain-containing protein [Bacteroidaceae bacterium]